MNCKKCQQPTDCNEDGHCFSCEMDELFGGISFVFWQCAEHPRGGVTWDHGKQPSVATCDVCGKTNQRNQQRKDGGE